MKKSTSLFVLLFAFSGIAIFTACKKSDSNNTPPAKPTLYDSLGGTVMVTDPANTSQMIEKGRLGLRSVVDSTIFVIAGDTAINSYFSVLLAEVTSGNTSGFMALSKNLTDFFCVGTGAKNFTYSGKSMVAAHDPSMNSRINDKVANDDFDAFIVDVVKGAKKNGLSDQLIGQVGTVLESLRSQVVQR